MSERCVEVAPKFEAVLAEFVAEVDVLADLRSVLLAVLKPRIFHRLKHMAANQHRTRAGRPDLDQTAIRELVQVELAAELSLLARLKERGRIIRRHPPQTQRHNDIDVMG